MRQLLFATLVIGRLASFGHAQQSTNLHKLIEANNKGFVEAFNRGDAAAVANMYTSDALLLPPNNPIIVGSQGIREFWQKLITAGLKAVRLETERVEVCGNTA